MITASGAQQRLAALEAGADDFVTKPFDQAELLARVASLARIKRYHDTVERQAEELRQWNAELETRVSQQVAELERTRRLRHFLSPQLADLVVGDEGLLQSHRREIVVVFCDLRNFTPFAETSEPEEVMGVLRDLHRGDRVPGARPRGHARAVHRRRRDGVLQRPGPVRRRRRARRQDGAGDPGRGPRPGRALAARRARPVDPVGNRPGLRDPGPDRLRGPFRLRRHRQRHEPGGPPVCRGGRVAGVDHRPRARRHRGPLRRRPGRRPPAQGVQPCGARPQRHGTSTTGR